MAVTREQFEAGLTYDAYKAQMTRNQEQFEHNERDLDPRPEDLDAFRRLPRPLHVLALAEDWCADVIANLPILGRIAKDSGKLDVRVLLRDQSPGSQVMDQYLKDGQFRSIPTMIFLDDDFNELGVWIERPASVTRLREEKRKAIYAAHPEFGSPETPVATLPEDVRGQLQAEIQKMRAETAPFANAEVVRELREIVERAKA